MPGLTRTRVRVAVAIALAVAIAAYVLPLRGHPFGLAVAWSALMLASFVGWGSLVNLWLGRGRPMDWGLRAGWGMAFFILTGGFLTATHLLARPVLVIQVLAGVGALLAIVAVRGTKGPHLLSRRRLVIGIGRSGTLALVALAYGLAAFTALANLGEHWFNASDDAPVYLTLAEKLVQTGSILEPFAPRRITTFGASSYLEAAFISVSTPFYVWVVDDGLGVMITVALLVGYVKRVGLRSWHWVPLGLTILLFFTMVSCRRNTASLFTGVAAIVTLFRTVRVPLGEELDRPLWPMDGRRAVALGALACVPVLLRTSSAAAVLPFVTLLVASDFLLGTRWPWGMAELTSLARVGALVVAAFLVALAPWSLMFAQSCGTPFYPLGHSNITPEWTYLHRAEGMAAVATGLVEDLFHAAPLASLVPFFIAGLAPLKGRARNDLVALSVASLIGLWTLAREATAFGAEDKSRYYYAYIVAMALLTTASVGRRGSRAAIVAACVGMHLAATREDFHKTLLWDIDHVSKVRKQDKDRDDFDARTGDYQDVQSYVPAGATMVTAVSENDRFDFTRNRVFALDVIGGMGPKPGWPTHQGPEALARYLVANGVQYAVWVDFDKAGPPYSKRQWEEHLVRDDYKGSYLQGEAAVEIDAADALTRLPSIRRLVYQAHNMSVVDLTSRPDRGDANGT